MTRTIEDLLAASMRDEVAGPRPTLVQALVLNGGTGVGTSAVNQVNRWFTAARIGTSQLNNSPWTFASFVALASSPAAVSNSSIVTPSG